MGLTFTTDLQGRAAGFVVFFFCMFNVGKAPIFGFFFTIFSE